MNKNIQLLLEKLFDDIYDDELSLSKQSENISLYSYYPKNKEELRELLTKLLNKRGPDADLNDIDISNITDLGPVNGYGLFEKLDPHNIDISEWNVSRVTDMCNMFENCKHFNCNLSKWNVSNVKYATFMFKNCLQFKGDGLDNWKLNNIEDTYAMFDNCKQFNCNVSNWNINNVEDKKIIDMKYMFFMCEKFKGEGLENWNINNKFISKHNMFNECSSLKYIPSWYN